MTDGSAFAAAATRAGFLFPPQAENEADRHQDGGSHYDIGDDFLHHKRSIEKDYTSRLPTWNTRKLATQATPIW